ncbi:hypothetical protein FDP41_009606 [Naegleria fowleri]|uniref:CNH domain-containing protein n=1 Tax=Naegleria fowleri TaxID=5763 RepID=A0A6A5BCV3_NAEFO|nr:uncharacterized protein FDP41_009606 [Naegleria fowleri]KAF0971910.1 hypothetical protein FDP41_009606 [Naegleria fowleri]
MPLILIDFVPSSRHNSFQDHCLHLFEKLSQKLVKGRERVPRAFSRAFQLVHTIDKIALPSVSTFDVATAFEFDMYLKHPSEVKISYHHACIIISDSGNQRMLFFDLMSKKFIFSLNIESCHFCVQENYDQMEHDALLLISSKMFLWNYCMKCDLQFLLQNSKSKDSIDDSKLVEKNCLWKSQSLSNVTGICVSRTYAFISELVSKTIYVLNLSSGLVVQTISLEGSPFRSDVIFDSSLFYVIEQKDEKSRDYRIKIFFLEKNDLRSPPKWKIVKSFGDMREGKVNSPKGICILDKREGSEFLLSSTTTTTTLQKNRIQIFRFGRCVKSFTTVKGLSGICLNEFTGELLVCHTREVSIYK